MRKPSSVGRSCDKGLNQKGVLIKGTSRHAVPAPELRIGITAVAPSDLLLVGMKKSCCETRRSRDAGNCAVRLECWTSGSAPCLLAQPGDSEARHCDNHQQ